jgi:beta-glucosidase
VVVVGNHPTCDAGGNLAAIFNMDVSSKPCADPGEGREGRDRESITLSQEELVKQVYAANPKTIVVLVSSFPYAINWSEGNVPAILHMTNATQELGTALADVLFGDYNPAGRLNQTWPKSLDQLPPMTDYNIRHGHSYMYFKGEPLYPFGYGLSYTKFAYSGLALSAATLKAGEPLGVDVDVKNAGKRDGDEVAELYLAFPKAPGTPIRALRGMQRIHLAPGETQHLHFDLKPRDLSSVTEAGDTEVQPGDYALSVGGGQRGATKAIVAKGFRIEGEQSLPE